MPINSNLPNPPASYDFSNEAQTRQAISLAFQTLNQVQTLAILAQKPASIANQSWWIEVNDATLVATLKYQNSAGVLKSLVLGTLS